jgi:hypothetical protein
MKNRILIVLLLVSSATAAEASMVWQPGPADTGKPSGNPHMSHGGGRGGQPYVLQQGQGAEAEMWLPTRVRRPLAVGTAGRVSVKGTGVSSYHLLFARKSSATSEEVAMRYINQHGQPSGESPASLVNVSKTALDINPAPLTREHQRYTSKSAFTFIVSYNGKPLVAQKVLLTTSNGSAIEQKSDLQGNVTFDLPDDFTDVEPGRSNNRPAEFVVSSSYVDGEKNYQTTLSAPYYVSPSHWQSMTGGLIAMFAGVVTGLVVLRRSTGNGASDASGRA